MSRSIKFILISALVLLIIIATVLFFLYREPKTENQDDLGTDSFNTQASATPLLLESVTSPTLSFSGDVIWFFDQQGKLFSIELDKDSQKKEFSLPEIKGFERAEWEPDGSSFIIQQNLEGHTNYSFYDAVQNSLINYPDSLIKPKFAFEGLIVYEWVTGTDKNQLQVSDETSKEFRVVAELFRDDYQIESSQAKNEVVLYSGNQINPSKIFLVNLETAQFQDLSVPLAVQGAKFSPDGSRLLVARWDQESETVPSLYIQDLVSRDIFIPDLFANVEQAVWSEDGQELYIADSKGIKKLDVNSNQILELYEFQENENFEPADLLLHPNRQSIFFIDKKTGYLYRVKL